MPKISTSATINCSVSTLRDFLGTIANLPEISDPDLQLEVLEAPDVVTQGETIEFRISAYGFKQRMQHKWITVTDTQIVAEQTDGPTKSWVHTQSIAESDGGGCVLTDEIEFEPPGGMLGYVMTEDKIKESIEDGMDFRYETLAEILEG